MKVDIHIGVAKWPEGYLSIEAFVDRDSMVEWARLVVSEAESPVELTYHARTIELED